jgi:hypothetical protein
LKILLPAVAAFIAGAAAAYVFLVAYPKWRAAGAVVVADGDNILPPRLAGTVLEPDPYAGAPSADDEPAPALSPSADEAGEIIDLLRTQSIDAPALISRPLTPATLGELFARHGGRMKLGATAVMTPDPRVKTILQMLPSQTAYWRPADLAQRELDYFLKQWATLKADGPRGLMIDLRNFRDGNNLAGAAAVAGLLAPPQEVLFTVEGLNFPQQVFRAQHQPLNLRQDFPIVVLVNHATRGAAEALAFTLRQKGIALVVGKKTAGEGGLFTETRLGSGRFLRLATAQISGADGTNLLDTPLPPDIPVEVSNRDDEAAFYGAYRYGIHNTAATRVPDRAAVREREDLDLPLDNSLTDRATPHDVMVSVADDVLSGITLTLAKAPAARQGN